jgi:hypothetical protein
MGGRVTNARIINAAPRPVQFGPFRIFNDANSDAVKNKNLRPIARRSINWLPLASQPLVAKSATDAKAHLIFAEDFVALVAGDALAHAATPLVGDRKPNADCSVSD